MANVYELLEQINSAIYGEDVRSSIHDAIEQCYEDATGNPDSVASLVSDVQALRDDLPVTIKIIETPVTISQGTAASPSSTEIDVSSYAPSGKSLYNALVTLGVYSLPYLGPNISTFTYVNSITNNKITITNGGAAWSGTQTAYIIGFFK